MKKALATLITALAGLTAAHAAPTEWSIGSGGNGHSYEYVAGEFTWDEARAAALGAGGYLATVTSAAENNFLASLSFSVAWLGANDNASEGTFRWIDGPEAGQALTFTSWNGGEPNNCCGGENYLQTNWDVPGGWNDHGGPGNWWQTNGYFVEFGGNEVPLPPTLPLMGLGLLALYGVRRGKKAA